MKTIMFYLTMIISLQACASKQAPLPTANFVDIKRYVGKWYSIASLPQTFTKKCKAQTAEYGIINAQKISVLNTCIQENKKTTISGEAVVVNPDTNAELEVTFNNFFTKLFRVKGDYTIIRLDEDYRYVLVGSKDRESLWILARDTSIPKEVYHSYVEFADAHGFPVRKLKKSNFEP